MFEFADVAGIDGRYRSLKEDIERLRLIHDGWLSTSDDWPWTRRMSAKPALNKISPLLAPSDRLAVHQGRQLIEVICETLIFASAISTNRP